MSTGRHNVPIYCRYDKSGTRPDIGATMCRLYRRCGPAIRRHNNRGTAVTRRMLIQWRLRSVSLLSTTTAVLICDRRDCGRAAGELQVYYSRLGGGAVASTSRRPSSGRGTYYKAYVASARAAEHTKRAPPRGRRGGSPGLTSN